MKNPITWIVIIGIIVIVGLAYTGRQQLKSVLMGFPNTQPTIDFTMPVPSLNLVKP